MLLFLFVCFFQTTTKKIKGGNVSIFFSEVVTIGLSIQIFKKFKELFLIKFSLDICQHLSFFRDNLFIDNDFLNDRELTSFLKAGQKKKVFKIKINKIRKLNKFTKFKKTVQKKITLNNCR